MGRSAVESNASWILLLTPNIEKYIAEADKSPGDVFNINTLLCVFIRFGITCRHRILLITNPVAPAVDWFLQLVTQQAALDPRKYQSMHTLICTGTESVFCLTLASRRNSPIYTSIFPLTYDPINVVLYHFFASCSIYLIRL